MNSKQSLYAFTNHPNQQTVMDEITNALKSLKMPGMAHYWTTITETRQADGLSSRTACSCLYRPS